MGIRKEVNSNETAEITNIPVKNEPALTTLLNLCMTTCAKLSLLHETKPHGASFLTRFEISESISISKVKR